MVNFSNTLLNLAGTAPVELIDFPAQAIAIGLKCLSPFFGTEDLRGQRHSPDRLHFRKRRTGGLGFRGADRFDPG